jgi:DNA-binding transcriptional LysR family regulator
LEIHWFQYIKLIVINVYKAWIVMDLRQIRYFVKTAEEGNVTRAAQELGITQPALSRQLRVLEESLGVPLFEKAGRGIDLTPEGRDLLPELRDLLARAAALRARAKAIAGEERVHLSLIAPVQSIEAFLAEALGRFARAFPRAEIDVIEAPADRVQALLEQDAGQIAVAAQPIGPQLPSRVLARGTVHVAMPLDHRFAGRGRIEVSDLDGEPVLAMRHGTLSRGLFESASRLAHMTPRVRHESFSPHALAAMVRAGMGLAIMPMTARPETPGLAFAKLHSGGRPLSADVAVIWNPNLYLTPAVETLFDMVAEEMHAAPFLEPV